ncbi:uncharacterized protein PAN0_005c2808 [Moesziomyces antarcticus]|uniref:Uncharacterized protein n=1 Tax=Pseudozyma antarctica TaxID=84753 RepID=A0A081CD48_PSEA2|nr:uncharacterized protein PAN0_005c2808 [Moesziomyces antarcticus]GAK64594.1 hypothetical protein PAN0_005c2808 [Moesziomyces antarcticus]
MSIDRPSEAPSPSFCPPATARTGQQLLVSDPARFFPLGTFSPASPLGSSSCPRVEAKFGGQPSPSRRPSRRRPAPLQFSAACSFEARARLCLPERGEGKLPGFSEFDGHAPVRRSQNCRASACLSLGAGFGRPPEETRACLPQAGSTLQISSQQQQQQDAFHQVDRARIRRPNWPSTLFILQAFSLGSRKRARLELLHAMEAASASAEMLRSVSLASLEAQPQSKTDAVVLAGALEGIVRLVGKGPASVGLDVAVARLAATDLGIVWQKHQLGSPHA